MNPRGSCRICGHPERVRIDELLRGKSGPTAVKRVYGFSAGTVYRHREHVIRTRTKHRIAAPSTRAGVAPAAPLASPIVPAPSPLGRHFAIDEAEAGSVEDLELRLWDFYGVAVLAERMLETPPGDVAVLPGRFESWVNYGTGYDFCLALGLFDALCGLLEVDPFAVELPDEGEEGGLESVMWTAGLFRATFEPYASGDFGNLLRRVRDESLRAARARVVRLAALLSKA